MSSNIRSQRAVRCANPCRHPCRCFCCIRLPSRLPGGNWKSVLIFMNATKRCGSVYKNAGQNRRARALAKWRGPAQDPRLARRNAAGPRHHRFRRPARKGVPEAYWILGGPPFRAAQTPAARARGAAFRGLRCKLRRQSGWQRQKTSNHRAFHQRTTSPPALP